jgi:L-lactate dehydrogenase (cytochrome)
LIARAAEAGFRTLVLTVDVPIAGARHRDTYNGLTFPPTLTKRTLIGMLRKPRWLLDALTTDPLAFESLGAAEDVMSLIDTVFDPSVTLADLEWLRTQWTGPIVVKGVQRVDDAAAIAASGIDGIAVSNHGGRQLDRAVSPIELLPPVVEAVGDSVEVYLDGGVRSGADVAAAVALGARAAFVARPYLYALMAGGEIGVDALLCPGRSRLRTHPAPLGRREHSRTHLRPRHIRRGGLPLRECTVGAGIDRSDRCVASTRGGRALTAAFRLRPGAPASSLSTRDRRPLAH